MEQPNNGDAPVVMKADELPKAVKARIERNRQKAVLLRREKATKRIFDQIDQECLKQNDRPSDSKKPDSRGGFILDREEARKVNEIKIIHKAGAILPESDRPVCVECNKTFNDSYLYDNFTAPVCDGCKNMEETHRLITKTEAKESYLLKDCDLDLREPPLKFLLKKNSRQPRWGEMKLYLECQVAQRAAEVWGSDEKLEEERSKRLENKNKMKNKKFNKKMEVLRREVMSSLYSKRSQAHEHEFGEETYREVDDKYLKTCKTCDHTMVYEKL